MSYKPKRGRPAKRGPKRKPQITVAFHYRKGHTFYRIWKAKNTNWVVTVCNKNTHFLPDNLTAFMGMPLWELEDAWAAYEFLKAWGYAPEQQQMQLAWDGKRERYTLLKHKADSVFGWKLSEYMFTRWLKSQNKG